MDLIIATILVVCVMALYFYISGRMYLSESYMTQEEAVAGSEKKDSNSVIIGEAGEVLTYDEGNMEKPYMTNESQRGDYEDPTYNISTGNSYEQDFIFTQEGGGNPTRDAINAARRRFPYDWAQLPPSASQFQEQQMLFSKEPVSKAAPYTAETFKDIDAVDILPPDSVAEAERQAKLLASYKPISAKDFGAPTTESVEDLVKKIYEPRGLLPIVKQQGQTNVYEIYETKEINPKIVYEDEVQRGMANPLEPLSPDVEKYVTMPTDTSIGLAPASEKTKMGRNSYATYDPSLEAMFGPRMAWQQWG